MQSKREGTGDRASTIAARKISGTRVHVLTFTTDPRNGSIRTRGGWQSLREMLRQRLTGHPEWMLSFVGEVWGEATTPLPHRQSLPKVTVGGFEDQIQGALAVSLEEQSPTRGSPAAVTIEAR